MRRGRCFWVTWLMVFLEAFDMDGEGHRMDPGLCYNKDAAVSPARLVRGLIGAYNERPHGDSKAPPYSVKARIRVDAQCTGRGALRESVAALCCASAALVADGQGVPAAATVRNVGAREHARQLGTTLGRTTLTQRRTTPRHSL